ncbi:MAG: MraY family glycosyltransferase [bacterium]
MVRPQDIHQKNISRFGGIFVILPFIAFLLAWFWLVRDLRLLYLSGLSFLILIFGLLDDKYDLNPFFQLIFQLILAILAIFSGIKIYSITNPFGGFFYLGIFANLFTILWIAGLVNVINWTDGIDGLACSNGLIGALALCGLSLLPKVNQPFSAILAGVLALILAVFLIFNFPPAKIFLGTSGSVFIGFMLAVISIISGGKVATAFLVLGIPIADAIRVVVNRIRLKKSVFRSDRAHLHHRLLDRGFSQKKALFTLILFPLAFGFLAIFLQSLGKFLLILILPLTFSAILIYYQ